MLIYYYYLIHLLMKSSRRLPRDVIDTVDLLLLFNSCINEVLKKAASWHNWYCCHTMQPSS